MVCSLDYAMAPRLVIMIDLDIEFFFIAVHITVGKMTIGETFNLRRNK